MRDFVAEPIRESAVIHAPLARCWALSTRVELVKDTLGMQLVAHGQPGALTAGFIVAGSRVHWRGWKFGLPTEHHTLITGFRAPHPVAAPAGTGLRRGSRIRRNAGGLLSFSTIISFSRLRGVM